MTKRKKKKERAYSLIKTRSLRETIPTKRGGKRRKMAFLEFKDEKENPEFGLTGVE